jgi:hypothetical protein
LQTRNLTIVVLLPYPRVAYSYFDQLLLDTEASNFGAALNDLNALEQATPQGFPGFPFIYNDLAGNDLRSALIDEGFIEPVFMHLCDGSVTTVQKLHLLRVGSDGSSSDVVVQQWSSTLNTVHSPTANDPYFFTQTQNAPDAYVNSQHIITNADQGAVYSWRLIKQGYCASKTFSYSSPIPWTFVSNCVTNVDQVTENHLTTSAGGAVSADVIWNDVIPGQNAAVQPVLQLADGSFVGSASSQAGRTMVAFDASGNINWTVPGYTPQMATADGGIITASGATFDASGSATGLLPNLPTFSWKAAYLDGDVQSVSVPSPTLATTFAAIFNGNLSGNGTAAVEHSFGLFWCGTGYALQEYVAGTPCVQNSGNDVRWGYYQANVGPTGFQDFSTQHPDWVGIIEREAFNSFKAAYAKYPVGVQLATFKPNLVPQQEYVAYVLGDSPWPTYGVTIRTTPSSKVYYFGFMENAQVALGQPENPSTGAGWVNYSPGYPTQDIAGFVRMLRALGTGIGNAAAHEMGHHLEDYGSERSIGVFPNMDCGTSPSNKLNPGVACENNDNFVYAFFNGNGLPQYGGTSEGAMFFYGIPGGTLGIPPQPAIHWGPSDSCWLQNYSAPGSCKKH